MPGKNIRMLNGKPLIVHSIEQAIAHPGIDRVFVSTDSKEIAEIAKSAGAEVPFIRPRELANDTSAKIPVIEHLVDWVEQNIGSISKIVDLDPTSPLRIKEDIDACINLLDDDTDAVVTGYKSDKNPYFNMVEEDNNGIVRLSKKIQRGVTSRQEAPIVYAMNASIYCWHYKTLKKGLWHGRTKIHVMPRERSVDIDDLIDFQIVEALMIKKIKNLNREK